MVDWIWLRNWRDGWRWLTQPTDRVVGSEARQKARLLASLSLALLLLGSGVLIVWITANPLFVTAPMIAGGTMAALAIVYGLSRSQYYQTGAFLLVLVLLVMVVMVIMTAPGLMTERMLALIFLGAVILVAGILMPLRLTMVIVVLCVGITAVFLFLPNVPFSTAYAYLTYIMVMSALLLVTFNISNSYLHRLRTSEERFRQLIFGAPDVIYLFNFSTGDVQFVNAEEFLGYSLAELQRPDSILHQVHPDDVAEVRANWQSLREGGEAYRHAFDYRVRHKLGQWEWVHNRLTVLRKMADGKPQEVLVTLTLITEMKRTQVALQESETRLRLVMNQIPAVMWTLDNDLRFTSSLGSALKGMGLIPNQAVGTTIYDFFDERDDDFVPIAAHRRALAGESQRYEQDWRGRVYQTYVEPLRDDEDLQIGVIGVALDVTEQVKTQKALQHVQKLESLGILAGGIAHDFNNLLVAMMMQTSLAMGKVPTSSQEYGHLEKAMQAANRAAELTRQMLAYSGRGKFEITHLQLNSLIEENLHLFQVAMPKYVDLRMELAADLPRVEADAGQMQQVVMNLILNGAEAIGEQGGEVVVRTMTQWVDDEREVLRQFTGEMLEPGLYVVLSVRDSGSGMDEGTMARIFDPFFTTKFTGRGLGLASVLGIVRGHHGGIGVESVVGEGTTFWLFFPALLAAVVEETAVAPSVVKLVEPTGCVLVIDDEEAVREAVTDVLALEGMAVVAAAGGLEGIALWEANRAQVRVVLLDLSMPGMNGEEVLAILKEMDEHLPVLLSSGYSEADVAMRVAAAGVAGFVQKPYDADHLLAVIRPFFLTDLGENDD
ncbi:MAG: response regulator [Ardenticatenaceae bacterium]|nr:response regulator [Ardenticatenaceae bacterium]